MVFDWLKSKAKVPATAASDRFTRGLDALLDEVHATDGSYSEMDLKRFPRVQALLSSDKEEQPTLLLVALDRYIALFKGMRSATGTIQYDPVQMRKAEVLQQLISQLLRRNLPYTPDDLALMLRFANDHYKTFTWYRPHNALLGVVERLYAGTELPSAITSEVRRIRDLADPGPYENSDNQKLRERAQRVLGEAVPLPPPLVPDAAWSFAILDDLASMDARRQALWSDVLAHAATATSSQPSAKWLAAIADRIREIGEDDYAQRICGWLGNIRQAVIEENDLPLRNDINATTLRGIIWTTSRLPPDKVARDITQMAQYCFRKIPNVGAVSHKVGNACLYVLGQLPGLESVAMLSELAQKVKYPSARSMVEKALEAAAERQHMSRDDLVELSVPDYNLDGEGHLETKIGDMTAELRIGAEFKTELLWRKADSKLQKSVPAALKSAHADEIKALNATVKELRSTLLSQVARIEHLFLRTEPWEFEQWRSRYLDHPLLRHITHKLIWHFEIDGARQSALPLNGKLCDYRGNPIEARQLHDTQVRLWHPVRAEADEVMAWREFFYAQGITQPFKQAHREVYLLTDAERQTEQYSNRFAAHILKQHQMNALCQQRGWRYSLQGGFDSWNAPTLALPEWNTSAEFFVEGIDNSINEAGIYNYVSSDQVRFLRGGELVTLQQVEPIVFTEVMRDVDLFVGVCSIGNDPSWQDGGIHTGFNDYWREYSFGDLLESAKTRKTVLAYLLPKLKIASQCEISDRFLKVQGQYRTYKIHLGSGNILMEPNDQYLCIVEARALKDADSRKLILPFEGDHRMALILSKAFLLASDHTITDKTILSQIRR